MEGEVVGLLTQFGLPGTIIQNMLIEYQKFKNVQKHLTNIKGS